MAKKLSQGKPTENLEDNDIFPVVKSGDNYKITFSGLMELIRDKFTDGFLRIINNLTSDSTTDALSAVQGKVLDNKKVDKVTGYGLSKNNLSDELLTKLNGISPGAQVNNQLKTINNQSIVGEGNVTISGNLAIVDDFNNPDPTAAASARLTALLNRSATNTYNGLVRPDNISLKVDGSGIISVKSQELPNYQTFIFKKSTTKPATPDISVNNSLSDPDPGNWDVDITSPFYGWQDSPSSDGIWWMSKATVNGNTNKVSGNWSLPIKSTGEDGINGNYIDFKYATNDNTTVAPSIDNDVRNPDGWFDVPPQVTSTTYLWMTQAIISNDELQGTWSAPVRISGENGSNGDWTSFVFKESDTVPATPTGTGSIPIGWSDVPESTGTWWMSSATINGITGLAGTWTTPVRVTGTPGEDGADGSYVVYQYAKNTSLTVAPVSEWSTTPPSLSSGDYLWMRFGTVVPPEASPATWSAPVRISGENGQNGKNGAMMLFMGDWLSTTAYTGTEDFVHVVKVGSTYYMTLTTAGTFTGNPVTDTSKWKTFDYSFDAIATKILFAEGANIGGWIFHKNGNNEEELRSQNGSSILNGTTGDVNITGSFESNSDLGTRFKIDSTNREITMKGGGDVISRWYNTPGNSGPAMEMYRSVLLEPKTKYRGILSSETSGFYKYLTDIDPDTPATYSLMNSESFQLFRKDLACRFEVNITASTLQLFAKNLPTSNPGIPGQIWNDGGTLKIST